MKATIIFGSPRKNGNTASLLKPFMQKLKDSGTEIEYIDVYEKKIAGCNACLVCQQDITSINCVIYDDMQMILKSIGESELIVIAAPIYLWAAPAPVKSVLDRMVYSACKYYGDDSKGPALLEGKRLALITTCGYPVDKGTDLYEKMMKRFCRHCKMTYAGMLAERHRNLKEPFMDEKKRERAEAFAEVLIYEI